MPVLDRLVTAAGALLAAFLSGYAIGFYRAEAAMGEETKGQDQNPGEDRRSGEHQVPDQMSGPSGGEGKAAIGGRVVMGLPPPAPVGGHPGNGRYRAPSPCPSSDADSDFGDGMPAAAGGGRRLVLVVRTDLKLTKGKVGSQLCHAALGQFKKLHRAKNPNLWDWEHDGRSTVVLRVSDAAGLTALKESAKTAGIPTHTVVDRSSQHSGPVKTVMALGPFATDAISEITGHLSLY
ncbi:unnamed protein product [Ostreobium quekettii]|uniref:peptidyl-tRNA hydrolase n=1 Tax=Ostreobium quekettii TaxID=121088 RepID=A0A8S1J931_9CHLO|nr:unnamed protein product [Ostreobium quekettii]|eukprot:evm.model.scf_2150.1 EVM.evm.TU.scf_2150.1   scf_2150:20101-23228(-)